VKWTFVWDDDDDMPLRLPVRCLDDELVPVVVIVGEAEDRRRRYEMQARHNKSRNAAKQEHAKQLLALRMQHVSREKQ